MKVRWETIRIGNVIVENQKSKLQVRDSISGGKFPFYTSGVGVSSFDDHLCDGENLFIATGGKACIQYYEGKAAYSTDCYSITTRAGVTPKFLFYFLDSSLALIEEHMFEGAALRHLQKTKFRDIVMPLPNLPEQQRIVGILDETFDGIAKAKANTEKNLKNTRALFESYLQYTFKDAWRNSELVKLSDLSSDITDGDHMPPPKAPTGVPFITIGNIVKDTRSIDFSNTFMVPHAYFNGLKANKKPKKGDVLYTVTGSFGIPVIVPENVQFCFQRHIGLIRPNAETNSVWLYYLLLSPQIFKQANDGATGTAQKTVSLKVLRNFEVPKVSFHQQQLMVAKLEELSSETQRLEPIYQQKLAALDELKKSLLNQAFNGEL